MSIIARDRGWAVVGSGAGAVTLICANKSLTNHAKQNVAAHISPYDFLMSIGLVSVAGDATNGSIKLSGGSVSECLLQREREEWFVLKRTSGSKLTNRDTWERHVLESQFIAATHTGNDSLFPSSTSRMEAGYFEAKMPFVPAYTLGEQIVQGRLSGLTFKKTIASIFRTLEILLYSQPTVSPQETYAEKVFRRLSLLLECQTIRDHVQLLCNRGARINGNECRSISELLYVMQSDSRCKEILNTEDPRLCHGDLIPEDILFLNGSDEFLLVDPNAQNTDPLVDLGKMAMSALVKYDLAIRDWVNCTVHKSDGGFCFQLSERTEWKELAQLYEEVGRWTCQEGRHLISRNVLPDHRIEPRAILLLSGLQAMAIPVFHALHHDNPDRALYFLAYGQLLAEQALQAFGL